ncbi:MAG: hypothetical protein RIR51_1570 [Bacteroidota bacterium]
MIFEIVAPTGIEPVSWVPETHILSIELRSQLNFKIRNIFRAILLILRNPWDKVPEFL